MLDECAVRISEERIKGGEREGTREVEGEKRIAVKSGCTSHINCRNMGLMGIAEIRRKHVY